MHGKVICDQGHLVAQCRCMEGHKFIEAVPHRHSLCGENPIMANLSGLIDQKEKVRKTGVILAGGEGTRLRPLTYVANKHLLPVYNKPMIYYPIETLKGMGVTDIILVSGGENIGGFVNVLGDGSALGVNLTYRVQSRPGGIAEALGCVEGLVKGLFPVILGDNYFEEQPQMATRPRIVLSEVENPERFGVYMPQKNRIIEKPATRVGNAAVTGLYFYDEAVFEVIKTLKPSSRGELEVTDINNWYLEHGAEVVFWQKEWHDMGTFDSLLAVANLIRNKCL